MTKGVLPTKRQVVRELNRLITEERGFLEYAVLKRRGTHTIRCLETALLMVKEWKKGKQR